jgi:hypothetical protein
MTRLAPMLAILLILAAGPASAEMSFAGAGADCTLIQGRWICSWDEPDAVERDVLRDAVKGKI